MSDFQPCEHLPLEAPTIKGDSLEAMLDCHRYLIKKFYDKKLDIHSLEEKREWTIGRINLAILDEISELNNALNFKWWKKPHELNEKEIKMEIIDLFKFVLTLMIYWGMTKDEILSYYESKYKENVRRQKEGY